VAGISELSPNLYTAEIKIQKLFDNLNIFLF